MDFCAELRGHAHPSTTHAQRSLCERPSKHFMVGGGLACFQTDVFVKLLTTKNILAGSIVMAVWTKDTCSILLLVGEMEHVRYFRFQWVTKRKPCWNESCFSQDLLRDNDYAMFVHTSSLRETFSECWSSEAKCSDHAFAFFKNWVTWKRFN